MTVSNVFYVFLYFILFYFIHLNHIEMVLQCKLNANSHTNTLNTGCMMNLHKTLRRCPRRNRKVSCTLELFTLSRKQEFSFLDMMKLPSLLAIVSSFSKLRRGLMLLPINIDPFKVSNR